MGIGRRDDLRNQSLFNRPNMADLTNGLLNAPAQPIEPVRHQLTMDDDGVMRCGGFALTTCGLVVQPDATQEDWSDVGDFLFNIDGAANLLLGDWLAYGEQVYGVTYDQVAELTGRDKQTLYNYKWVMGSVEFSRRRENLAFGHYAEVAALDAYHQEFWLDQAAARGLSVAALRKLMREVQDTNQPGGVDEARVIRSRSSRLAKFWAGKSKAKPEEVLADIREQRMWLDQLERAARAKGGG